MVRRITLVLLIAAIAAGAQITLESSTRQDATGPNSQQKLDRVPGTDICNAVWHSRTPGNIFFARWGYYNTQTQSWVKDYIPIGNLNPNPLEKAYPAVSATNNTVAFAYLITWESDEPHIKDQPPLGLTVAASAVRYVNGQIYQKALAEFGEEPLLDMWAEPPSIAGTSYVNGDTLMVFYVAFIDHDIDNYYTIACQVAICRLFISKGTVSEPYIDVWCPFRFYPQGKWDTTGGVMDITNLSMAIDGDMGIHCTWLNSGTLEYWYMKPDNSYYGPAQLSFPSVSEPHISVYGDSAHIVYNEAGSNHIKHSSHFIGAPPEDWYFPAAPIEARGSQYSRNQPYRRFNANVWQEQDASYTYETFDREYYNLYGEWISPVGDQHPAYYPNVNPKYVIWPPQGVYGARAALWTEQTGTNDYEVRFRNYSLTPTLMSSASFEDCPVYLGIKGGDEQQPYAMKRDGFWSFRDHSLDYDSTELLYKVSYLEPPYEYLVRMLVSLPEDARIPGVPSGKTANTQRVFFDGVDAGQITYAPGMSDTLYALISPDAYEKDRRIMLSIQGLAGSPAVLEELTVYRFETEPVETQGSSDIDEAPLPAKIKLWTTQTSDAVIVYYSLCEPSQVVVNVFDCSGRCVSSDEVQGASGVNSLSLDKQGMSAGVYFIRVSTPGESATCKTINLH